MKILTKYTFKEIVPNYFLGLSFFTLILLINEIFRLVAMVVEKNIPIVRVLSLFIYTLPYILAVTIPIGVLVGTIFAIGRLSSDSEIVAMRASGVSLLKVFLPSYLFGFIITISAVLFFQFVLPWGNQNYMKMYFKIIRGNPAINLMQNQNINIQGLRIMVDSVDVKNQELYKVRIIDRRNKKIIFAEWGRFLPRDNENNLFPLQLFFTTTQPYIYLPNKIRKEKHQKMGKGQLQKRITYIAKRLNRIDEALKKFREILRQRALTDNEKKARKALVSQKRIFLRERQNLTQSSSGKGSRKKKSKGDEFEERWDEMSLIYIKDNTPINPQFSGPQMASITDLLDNMERTRLMLKVLQVRLVNNLVRINRKYLTLSAQIKTSKKPKELRAKLDKLRKQMKKIKKRINYYYSGATLDRQIVFQFHNKLSIPFACFFFAVLAAPLGVFSKRSGKGIGIGIAILVLMGYRILMVVGKIGYTKNLMPPALAAWFPNILMILAAVFFTYMRIKSKIIQINLDWLFARMERIKKHWEKKDYSFMQGVFYAVIFPIKAPYIYGIKFYKWIKLQRNISFIGFFKRAYSENVNKDEIFGDIEYETVTQSYPGKGI